MFSGLPSQTLSCNSFPQHGETRMKKCSHTS